MTKPVLYYYFKNKEGIFCTILDWATEKQGAIIAEVLGNTGPVVERLKKIEEAERLKKIDEDRLKKIADEQRLEKVEEDDRLKKIEEALHIAVPQLKHLTDTKDESGIPHLEAIYEHWKEGSRQREDQFSDGTLRLIGLLWALLDEDSLLLLEEPELSLNIGIINRLPALIHT